MPSTACTAAGKRTVEVATRCSFVSSFASYLIIYGVDAGPSSTEKTPTEEWTGQSESDVFIHIFIRYGHRVYGILWLGHPSKDFFLVFVCRRGFCVRSVVCRTTIIVNHAAKGNGFISSGPLDHSPHTYPHCFVDVHAYHSMLRGICFGHWYPSIGHMARAYWVLVCGSNINVSSSSSAIFTIECGA